MEANKLLGLGEGHFVLGVGRWVEASSSKSVFVCVYSHMDYITPRLIVCAEDYFGNVLSIFQIEVFAALVLLSKKLGGGLVGVLVLIQELDTRKFVFLLAKLDSRDFI